MTSTHDQGMLSHMDMHSSRPAHSPRASFAIWLSALLMVGCLSPQPSSVLPGGKAADHAFLEQYDTARARAIQEVPLAFLAMPQKLVVVRHGRITQTIPSVTPTYTALKDISHILLALYVASWHLPPAEAAGAVAAYAPYVDTVSSGLAKSAIPESDRLRQQKLLASAQDLIRQASTKKGVSQEWIDLWARGLGPDLLLNSRAAARSQLELINREMTAQIKSMTPKEKQTFIVIVSGAHQARAENLWMQYLGQLLGPKAVADERRRVYAESVYDNQGALDLLGSHVMDRSIGEAFFSSPTRMQRDLLGDAAKKIIPTLTLPDLTP